MTAPTPDSYLVIIERGPSTYGAYAPDLPGCVATGRTVDECERNMREAIAAHLAVTRDFGETVPVPSIAAASWVRAAAPEPA